MRCNVTSWDDQVDLFQAAFDTFGSVDIVVRSGSSALQTRRDHELITGRERRGERDRRLLHTKSQERQARETGDGYRRREPAGTNIQ